MSRTRVRRILLILTAVVLLLSFWKTFGRLHRTATAPTAPVATVPASNAQPGIAPATAGDATAVPANATSPSSAATPAPPAEPASTPRPVSRKPAASHPAPVTPTPAVMTQPGATLAASSAAALLAAPPPATTTPSHADLVAPVVYVAHHQHAFPYLDGKSCEGTLQLTATNLVFSSSVHPVTVTRAEMSAIGGNTVVEASGKKWRFDIRGMSNAQVHALLAKWFAESLH